MRRRTAIKKLGLGLAGIPLLSSLKNVDFFDWKEPFSLDNTKDEKFWKRFKKSFYPVSKEFTNLENGYFGLHPGINLLVEHQLLMEGRNISTHQRVHHQGHFLI